MQEIQGEQQQQMQQQMAMTAQEQAPAMAAVEQKSQEMLLNAANESEQAPEG